MHKPARYSLKITPKTKVLNVFRKLLITTGVDKLLAEAVRIKPLSKVLQKFVPPNYLYDLGTKRRFQVKGINYLVDISDTVGHSNYYSIPDDGHARLYALVKPGMTVYDIGANMGSTTLNLSKLVGSNGKIVSFEPDSTNFGTATGNIALNDFKNITIFNYGLGDTPLEAFQYVVNNKNRGMMRILPGDPEEMGYDKSKIKIDTLDNMVRKESLPPPQLIKLDVEGFEFKVLKGARETLTQHHPTLFIELDDENLQEQGTNGAELVGYLESLGYQIKNAATLEELTHKSDFTDFHIDILCNPRQA